MLSCLQYIFKENIMALIPVLCPNCGASIEIESNDETYTCKHCGTSFVTEKVINNNSYNTVHNITNNITKVVNGDTDDDADDFFNRGLSHLKLDNITDAKRCFAEAIRKDPSGGLYYFYYLVAATKKFTSVEGYFNNLIIYNDGADYYFKLDYIFKLLNNEQLSLLTKEYGINFKDGKSAFVFDIAKKFYSTSLVKEPLVNEQYYLLNDPDNFNNKIFELLDEKSREKLASVVEDCLQDMMTKKLDFSKMFNNLCNLYLGYFNIEKFYKSYLKKAKGSDGTLVINELTRKIFEKDGVLKIDDPEITMLDFRLEESTDDFNKIIITNNLTDFLLSGAALPVFKTIEFENDVPLSKVEQFFNFYLLSTNTEVVILPSNIADKKLTLNLNFRFGKNTDSNKIATKFKIAKNIKLKIKAVVKDRTGIFTYISKHTSTEKGIYTYSLSIKKGKTKKQKRDLSMLGWLVAGAIALGIIVFFGIKILT